MTDDVLMSRKRHAHTSHPILSSILFDWSLLQLRRLFESLLQLFESSSEDMPHLRVDSGSDNFALELTTEWNSPQPKKGAALGASFFVFPLSAEDVLLASWSKAGRAENRKKKLIKTLISLL